MCPIPELSSQVVRLRRALLTTVVAITAIPCLPVLAAPPQEGADLLRRVQVVYGQSRRAIRSVEYDYTFNMNGMTRQARFARDGERYYLAGVWVLENGFSMAKECAWDGQRVHDRWTPGRMNRSTDRSRFDITTPLPETNLNLHVTWALGFEAELEPGFKPAPNQKYRFLRGKTVEDKDHGSCIELEFAGDFAKATLLSRHARRYAYAPVYSRFCGTAEGSVPTEEVTDVRFVGVQSDGNELHYPLGFTVVAMGGQGKGGNTLHFRIDQATLKINQPIPRSRFVIEPWPNEDVYDWEKDKLTAAKEPAWSPVGNVGFPWDGFLALAERNRATKQAQLAVAGGGPLPVQAPLLERLGWWLVLAGFAVVTGAGYLVYRRRSSAQRGGAA